MKLTKDEMALIEAVRATGASPAGMAWRMLRDHARSSPCESPASPHTDSKASQPPRNGPL